MEKTSPSQIASSVLMNNNNKKRKKNSNETQIESDFYSFQSQSELVRNAGVHLI